MLTFGCFPFPLFVGQYVGGQAALQTSLGSLRSVWNYVVVEFYPWHPVVLLRYTPGANVLHQSDIIPASYEFT